MLDLARKLTVSGFMLVATPSVAQQTPADMLRERMGGNSQQTQSATEIDIPEFLAPDCPNRLAFQEIGRLNLSDFDDPDVPMVDVQAAVIVEEDPVLGLPRSRAADGVAIAVFVLPECAPESEFGTRLVAWNRVEMGEYFGAREALGLSHDADPDPRFDAVQLMEVFQQLNAMPCSPDERKYVEQNTRGYRSLLVEHYPNTIGFCPAEM